MSPASTPRPPGVQRQRPVHPVLRAQERQRAGPGRSGRRTTRARSVDDSLVQRVDAFDERRVRGRPRAACAAMPRPASAPGCRRRPPTARGRWRRRWRRRRGPRTSGSCRPGGPGAAGRRGRARRAARRPRAVARCPGATISGRCMVRVLGARRRRGSGSTMERSTSTRVAPGASDSSSARTPASAKRGSGSAVSITTRQRPACPGFASVNSASWWLPLNSTRKSSSVRRSPRRPGHGQPLARQQHLQRPCGGRCQSCSDIGLPLRANQAMSWMSAPCRGRPWNHPAAAERRMHATEPDQPPGERQQVLVDVVPVDPRQLARRGSRRCCCRCWVRPSSSPWEQHRHALGQQQRGQEVALLAGPQRLHLGVGGRALDPVVGRAVVVVPSVLSSPLASLCLSLVADRGRRA